MSTTTPTPAPTQPFESALAQLKVGKRIRRQSWPAGCFINLDPKYEWPGEATPTGNIQRHDANGAGQYMALSSRDVLATDWEIL